MPRLLELVRGSSGSLEGPLSRLNTRSTLLALVGIWMTGVVGGLVIVGLQARVDTQRRAEVVMGTLQRQVGDLASIAFAPAIAQQGAAPTVAETNLRLASAKVKIDTTVDSLGRLGHPAEVARLNALDRRYFRDVQQITALISKDAVTEAGQRFSAASRPGGSYGALLAEMQRASTSYSNDAERSRRVGSDGVIASLAVLLLAFSIALLRAARLTREKHDLLEQSRVEALTDALTGLPNRRKLFLDLASIRAESPPPKQLALGMFDLDGFKAYNDTFGHPAGDALLARCGARLTAVVDGHGSGYRIGGDEFCVVVRSADSDSVMAAAADALSEHGDHFEIGCSRGTVLIAPTETTIDQALQQADQRLYNNKRSLRGGEAHDVLLTVLANYDASLATHLSNVGELSEAVARKLDLSEEDIALTRLTAELHDVGKTAIPTAILNKPGPLDPNEWILVKRHTIIGERILAAAPALARVGPLVRATHERIDGQGYPDGLSGNQIPLPARIVAAVDAYDAMTSQRPYGPLRTPDQALAELRRCARTQFDPTVVHALTTICREKLNDQLVRTGPETLVAA